MKNLMKLVFIFMVIAVHALNKLSVGRQNVFALLVAENVALSVTED